MSSATDLPTKLPSSFRLDYLDGIRALCALYVVLAHCFETIYLNGVGPWWLNLFTYGHQAVVFFIVTSGFSLYQGMVKSDFRLKMSIPNFYKRRFIRIVPTYWCSIALSIALALTVITQKTGTQWDLCVPVSWKGTLEHIFLLQDWLHLKVSVPDYPLWTIAIEFHLYFLFPLILFLQRSKFRLSILAILCLAATVVGRFLPDSFNPSIRYDFLFFAAFTFGAVGGRLADSTRVNRDVLTLMAIISGCLFIATTMPGVMLLKSWKISQTDLPIALFAASLMATLKHAPANNALRQRLEARQLVRIGSFSYSLYLIHAPMIQLCYVSIVRYNGLTGLMAFYVTVGTGLVVSVAAAAVFSHFFEKPFLVKRKAVKPEINAAAA